MPSQVSGLGKLIFIDPKQGRNAKIKDTALGKIIKLCEKKIKKDPDFVTKVVDTFIAKMRNGSDKYRSDKFKGLLTQLSVQTQFENQKSKIDNVVTTGFGHAGYAARVPANGGLCFELAGETCTDKLRLLELPPLDPSEALENIYFLPQDAQNSPVGSFVIDGDIFRIKISSNNIKPCHKDDLAVLRLFPFKEGQSVIDISDPKTLSLVMRAALLTSERPEFGGYDRPQSKEKPPSASTNPADALQAPPPPPVMPPPLLHIVTPEELKVVVLNTTGLITSVNTPKFSKLGRISQVALLSSLTQALKRLPAEKKAEGTTLVGTPPIEIGLENDTNSLSKDIDIVAQIVELRVAMKAINQVDGIPKPRREMRDETFLMSEPDQATMPKFNIEAYQAACQPAVDRLNRHTAQLMKDVEGLCGSTEVNIDSVIKLKQYKQEMELLESKRSQLEAAGNVQLPTTKEMGRFIGKIETQIVAIAEQLKNTSNRNLSASIKEKCDKAKSDIRKEGIASRIAMFGDKSPAKTIQQWASQFKELIALKKQADGNTAIPQDLKNSLNAAIEAVAKKLLEKITEKDKQIAETMHPELKTREQSDKVKSIATQLKAELEADTLKDIWEGLDIKTIPQSKALKDVYERLMGKSVHKVQIGIVAGERGGKGQLQEVISKCNQLVVDNS